MDLNWRESEIAYMRILLSNTEASVIQKKTLLRAAWAMLYAHYEGFCKNTLSLFFDEAKRRDLTCAELPKSTQVLALRRVVKSVRSLPDLEFIDCIRSFRSSHLESKPSFPEVETDSNLYPDTLIKLMSEADLATGIVSENRLKLNTLVSRRNKIAHGEKNFIEEVEYYHGYEKAVYDVIYDLAYQVDSRLSEKPYVKGAEHDSEQDVNLDDLAGFIFL